MMKKLIQLCLFFLFSTQLLMAQYPSSVKQMEVNPNGITEAKGDLKDGSIIEDLSWAANSSVACFPGTQNAKFRGNHVFHAFQIPPYAELTVTLIPADKNVNFSLYGYQVGTTNYSLPPNLSSCVSCEADHKWDRPVRGKTQDHTRSVFFNSIKNPYNIVIGVTGEAGLTSGAYIIRVEMKSRLPLGEQADLKIYKAKSEKGQTLAYTGNLNEGTKVEDLSWAANSSVACFPATQNTKFRGNHVFYVTEIPARSKMKITLIPDDKNADMSLYAWQDGTTSTAFPPNLNSCVTCEADHKWDYPKRGQTQDHTRSVSLNAIQNPYRVVIGVAGPEGVTTGGFRLEIMTE